MANIIKSSKEFRLSGEDKILIKHEEFDQNGNMLSRIFYDEGTVSGKEIRQFNADNKVVNYKEFLSDTELSVESVFSYNNDGKLIQEEKIFVHAGGYKSFVKYAYNNDTEIILTEDEDGEFEGKIEKIYNSKKQLTESKTINEHGKIDTHFLLEYDDNERIIKKTELPSDTTNYQEIFYTYNTDNLVTAELTKNKKGKDLQKIIREYDEQKRPLSVKLGDFQNKKSARYEFSYQNNKTEVSYYENGILKQKEITYADDNERITKFIVQSDFTDNKPQNELISIYEYEFWAD